MTRFSFSLSETQHDRLLTCLGDALPDSIRDAHRILTSTGSGPNAVDIISVICTTDVDDALTTIGLIRQWLIDHAEDRLEAGDRRRRTARVGDSLLVVARKMEHAGRLPRLVTVREAAAVSRGAPLGFRAHIRRTGWTIGEAEHSFRWIERHRILARHIESNPSTHTRRGVGGNGLGPQGMGHTLLPEWWMLLAPTAHQILLPKPGDDPYDTALRWYQKARTTPRLHLVADACDGPARWGRAWSIDFLAVCCAPWPSQAVSKPLRRAVEDAWHDAAAEPDSFDGGPLSPYSLGVDVTAAEVIDRARMNRLRKDKHWAHLADRTPPTERPTEQRI
jgi:hypothetical protein